MLVDAPHEADVRCTAEDALHLCRRAEQSPRIHVNIDKVNNKTVEGFLFVVFLNQRAHTRCALLCEVFIRIRKDNPVALRLIKCKILRRREVIDPVEMVYEGSSRTCSLHRRIR